ncbi:hypothetical protein ACFP4H_21820 [Pseudophaeobacter arcticus]|uniref:hypothetical protein n=1 Tax=Pseudophaeobacter arcticus TaxID=385492 RepID=UPI000408577A|nr:hypothetical protein [Pseudophaeobacter arcticus]
MAEGHPEDSSENRAVPKNLGAKTVIEWERKERRFGLAGLYDKKTERGNRDRRLTADELMNVGRIVSKYLDDQQPSQTMIFGEVKDAFDDENKKRRGEGQPEPVCPSRERYEAFPRRTLSPSRRVACVAVIWAAPQQCHDALQTSSI